MKNKIFIIFCFLSLQFFSQTITGVDTLIKNGPIGKRINLVIMGDGYTAAQMPQFITNATAISNYILNTPPFSSYRKYFNVFAIKCPSPQSGISHPGTATDVTEPVSPTVSVVNNFNTKFDNYGVHRLIYSMNSSAVYAVLAAGFPAYDQIIILGNSTVYGGAGGSFAVLSVHPSSNEIAAHEMGHSFAGLADEYWAGASYAAEKPNMTANTNTATVKWNQWLGINLTGLYPYDVTAPANTWFRPHENCKMQVLGAPFCSVCRQTIVEKIHNLTNPIDDYFPNNTSSITYTAASQPFKTILVKPNPYTLKRTWSLNSSVIASNADSVLIPANLLVQGNNSVLFTVTDTTVLSKDVNHAGLHSYSVVWSIDYSNVGITEIKTRLEFSIFPNPATDVLYLDYTLMETSEVGVSVIDMAGKELISRKTVKTEAGTHKNTINVSELSAGNYILALKVNNKTINNKFIIVK